MSPADKLLAADMGRFYADPLGFVMYAYPWDTDRALQMVKLPSPWDLVYPCEYGPDLWACELLTQLGEEVRARGFDGQHPVEAIQMAVSSGHGIGKSAMAAWLTHWIMSTRPHSRGVITANTAEQLASKTWAGVSAWVSRSVNAHWFQITTGKGAMRMAHVEAPDTWRVDAQTSREENSEAFAGLHAANSTPWYLFDEASAIPAKIWEVAEGGKTDGEPMHFAFGNPTRTTGSFADCFGKQRHRWITRTIDSRDVAITNKVKLQQWVDDYGEDSDFVRVRVRGIFPRASDTQLIARDLVDAAMRRELPNERLVGRIAAVGVDVARNGSAQSVIATRIGRDARTVPAKHFRGLDTMQLASRVVQHVAELRALGLQAVVFVDGGGVGGGVVDRLRQLRQDCVEVQFGGQADDVRRYANKRSEMWGRLAEWIPGAVLEHHEDLATDLTGPDYSFTKHDQILLESKDSMEERGLASPDWGDALALTHAHPVPDQPLPAGVHSKRQTRQHDPYAADALAH